MEQNSNLQLIKRIEKLEEILKSLTSASTIPLNISKSLQSAGFSKGKIDSINLPDSSRPDPTLFIDTDISAVYEGMSLPTFWLKVEGTNYYIPVYIKSEFL